MFRIGDRVVANDPYVVGNEKTLFRGVIVGYSGRIHGLRNVLIAVKFDNFVLGHCCVGRVYNENYDSIPIDEATIDMLFQCPRDLIHESEYDRAVAGKRNPVVPLKFKIGDKVKYHNAIYSGMDGCVGAVVGVSIPPSGCGMSIRYAVAIDGIKNGHGCSVELDYMKMFGVVGSWDVKRKDLWWCSESELSLFSSQPVLEDALEGTLGKSKEELSREYFIGRFPQISKIIRSSGKTGHPITIVVLRDGRKGIVRLQESDVDNFDVAVLYAYIKAKEKKVVVIDPDYQKDFGQWPKGVVEAFLRSVSGGRRNGK